MNEFPCHLILSPLPFSHLLSLTYEDDVVQHTIAVSSASLELERTTANSSPTSTYPMPFSSSSTTTTVNITSTSPPPTCRTCHKMAMINGQLQLCECAMDVVYVGAEEIKLSATTSPSSSPGTVKRSFSILDSVYTPAALSPPATSIASIPPSSLAVDLASSQPMPTTNIATFEAISVDVLWNALNRVLDSER